MADETKQDGRSPSLWQQLKVNSAAAVLRSKLRGSYVGSDHFGNRYYRERGATDWRRERRWVLYALDDDPSMVPPGWFGWLHHRFELPPTEAPLPGPRFEREHLPNLSGTPAAYVPPGSLRRPDPQDTAKGDYEPWRPE